MRFNDHVSHLPYDLQETHPRTRAYEHLWKTAGLRLLMDEVENPAGLRLLDYGCGRGEFMGMAKEAGFEPEGCDPDPECVKMASERGKCQLLGQQSPLELYERKSFDVITCTHVLEHVDCPLHALEKMRELCKGYLLLGVPNLRVLSHFRLKPFPDKLIVNEGHLHGWDHQTFLNLCMRHAGLEFVAWGHDATALPVLSIAVQKLFGFKAAFGLEKGVFLKSFPYHCHSVLGLFRCPPD